MPFGRESVEDAKPMAKPMAKVASHQCLSAGSPLRTFVDPSDIDYGADKVTNAFRQGVR